MGSARLDDGLVVDPDAAEGPQPAIDARTRPEPSCGLPAPCVQTDGKHLVSGAPPGLGRTLQELVADLCEASPMSGVPRSSRPRAKRIARAASWSRSYLYVFKRRSRYARRSSTFQCRVSHGAPMRWCFASRRQDTVRCDSSRTE